MVGQHSKEELAAAGFINNLFLLALLLTIGYSIGAVSRIGSLYAQGRTERIVSVLKSSIVADSLQCIVIIMPLVALYFVLPMMGQPEELLPMMRPYLLIQIVSLPFMVLTGAFKQMTDSVNDTMVGMAIMIVGNVWNIFFNWVLIFGNLGAPEMGIMGAAWATFSSRVLMFIVYIMYFFLAPRYKMHVKHWRSAHANRKDVLLLNRLGWPISVQMGMEGASFSIVAIFVGWLGTNALAAHQVMITISGGIYMTYVGISNAVAIRVSNYNGLKDMAGARHATFGGYQMILMLSVVLSILAFIFRNDMSYLFTPSYEVSAIVATMVYPLILYQLGDGMQVVFANGLRGLGDVKKLMKYSFFAYIIVSLPLSYLMGIIFNWGAFGVWMAFPFGLTMAGVLYLRYFLKVTRNNCAKV